LWRVLFMPVRYVHMCILYWTKDVWFGLIRFGQLTESTVLRHGIPQ